MNSWNSILRIAIWAGATCGLALAVVLPSSLQAVGPEQPAKLIVESPRLMTQGVELTLTPAVGDIKPQAGESLSLTLVAKNTSDKAVSIEPRVSLNSVRLRDRMSRVAPVSQDVWTRSVDLTLQPGETKAIQLDRTEPLASDSAVAVVISSEKESVVVMRLNIPTTASR